ncbi:hypothetical protein HBI56_065760 [Parastagonospora nodorum]|uniref:Mid2 domain-containing protein n=2 Tax=Phaeosphaeria nodorum (strain SN15 / ATCC MYA-4574 / FGSC 10173) TaxID=321614 RepID=A0A7U2ERZ5_PHANO|nr:hypothetical protein HBH56_000410 [Parastagonospora nodorum]QRC90049.1 hypothetical protein JI435_094730 [Parastagonospora nodorum SN15]KAH3938162.1 hypothetical protein HBH54_000420 [Parastagonospora nodorum]KAH3940919.1 hypothetical protein HBH53_209680 [Parastagonospora nodorum]KAH3958454.1 hypothetical protein HBH51_208250 [Parastagonospora nodorum]
MHYPHVMHPETDALPFVGFSSTVQQASLTSGMSDQETPSSIGDDFTVPLSYVPTTTTASDPGGEQTSITTTSGTTSGTEIEGPSTTESTFTVPLTNSPMLTQTVTPPSQPTQPGATSTPDISTIQFQYPWETTIPPFSAPSTLLTTAIPSLIITVPTSDSSPTPSSSLSAGAIAGITIGAILATVFGGAALFFYLYRKNEKRANEFEMHRVKGRVDGEKVDLSPGA